MVAPYRCRSLVVALLLLVAPPGCKSSDNPEPDIGIVDDLAPPPDTQPAPDQADPNVTVGAVQYTSGNYAALPGGCTDDLCGLTVLIKDAKKQKAEMVVVPEASIDQTKAELAPTTGDAPVTDARWNEGSIIKTFAKLALDEKLYLIFNVATQEGSNLYNTNIAVGPDGKVLARHFKVQLYSSEVKVYTPGTSLAQSFFTSPAGRTGLLICADAQCVVTKMKVTPDCTSASAALLKTFWQEPKPDLIFFSAWWQVGGTGIWSALNVQKSLASYGPSYLAAANNTDGQGKGGGIYDMGGNPLAQDASGKPVVVIARVPRKK